MCRKVLLFLVWLMSYLTVALQFLLDPKELAILSILDFSNDVVVRDLLTMVRSLRLFGGNLNEATLIIGVIASCNKDKHAAHYSKEHFHILHDLAQLGAHLEYLDGVGQSNRSRTMNKLQIFRLFDPIKFSHILWLDADILILNDPTPYIVRHAYPGSVDCVPELYSYMRRYPKINTTNHVWNSQLPSVTLLGANEEAPSGTCNTGVMLFDNVVLPRLVRCIEELESNRLVIPEEYLTDRFLDSLYFVLAVNMEAIAINYLPYSFNYMAFFIGEYSALELGIKDIFFAHFLWDPYFFCFIPKDGDRIGGGCECISSNEHQQTSDILYRIIDSNIVQNVSACRFLAGVYPSNYTHRLKFSTMNKMSDKAVQKDHSYWNFCSDPNLGEALLFDTCDNLANEKYVIGFSCTPLWPPIFYDKKLVASNQIVSISFVLACKNNQAEFVESFILTHDINNIKGRIRVSLKNNNLVVNSSEEIIFTEDAYLAKKENPSQFKYFRSTSIDISIHSEHFSVDNDISKIFSTIETLTVDLQYSILVKHPQFGDMCIDRVQQVEGDVDNVVFNVVSSTVSLHDESVVNVPKRAVYSINPLKTPRSLSLASQLLIPEYIKSSLLINKGMRSILFCCESMKGMKATQRLLQHMSNAEVSVISLVLLTLPKEYLMKELTSSSSGVLVTQDLVDSLFESFCQQHSLGKRYSCHIMSLLPDLVEVDAVSNLQTIAIQDIVTYLQAFAPKSIHFIYFDLFAFHGYSNNSPPVSRDALFRSLIDFAVICRSVLVGNGNSLLLGSFHYSFADDVALFDQNGNVELISIDGNNKEIPIVPSTEFVSFMWQHQLVLQMSMFLQSPSLYTYAESLETYCAIEYLDKKKRVNWWRECSPAWYFVY